ncbi:hypothetical protein [Serratia fonticola]|uniref:hypothetical protein n=1 Tax=Serratia fonticola TaxID=47917 RepID=UPI003AAE5355
MDQQKANALRSVAKECNKALHGAIEENPKTPFDKLSRPIIMSHFEKIKPLGISLARFLYTIGMLNGLFTER